MNKRKIGVISVGLFLGVMLSPGLLRAESSLEYSKLGRVVLSAFKCSVFAEKAEKTDEQQRLFLAGYQNGREFIEALKGGRIKEKDFKQEVPVAVQMLVGGPSTDFMLGRVYEFSVEQAYKELGRAQGRYSEEMIKSNAGRWFSEKNCKQVGS